MKNNPDITVIGPGSLGTTLIDNLQKSGYPVRSVISRKERSDVISRFSNLAVLKPDAINYKTLGNIIFITTPDDTISQVANSISQSMEDWSDHIVVHCSGFLTSEELLSLKQKGANVAAFHPLQTFVEKSGEKAFQDIFISIEGDDQAFALLAKIAKSLGATPIQISQKQKRILHIAAVFMSNYVVALGSLSNELIKECIPNADIRLLIPLMRQTVLNLEESNPFDALSGPIERGDSETVRNHISELGNHEKILKLYKHLGLHTLEIVEAKGETNHQSLSEINEMLRKDLSGC
jgi:predicted short-subunit dehydrogenase-like oxidoreductase (DUF2520 family)